MHENSDRQKSYIQKLFKYILTSFERQTKKTEGFAEAETPIDGECNMKPIKYTLSV